jgi:hypothetical protein
MLGPQLIQKQGILHELLGNVLVPIQISKLDWRQGMRKGYTGILLNVIKIGNNLSFLRIIFLNSYI